MESEKHILSTKKIKYIIGKDLMNICVVTHTFPRFPKDAAAPFMQGLCQGLSNAGNKVYVVTPFSTFFPKKISNKYYTVKPYKYIFPEFLHSLGYSNSLVDDKKLKIDSLLFSPFMILFGVIHLLQIVKSEKIDVISAHWILPNGLIGAVVASMAKVTLVSTLPGSDVYLARKNWLFRALALFAAKKSDGITSNSPRLASDLKEIGAQVAKYSSIVYGVDTNIFKPDVIGGNRLRKLQGIRKNEVVVLGVGRLVEKKGFQYLIEAAVSILRKHKNVRFVIIGTGDLMQQLVLKVQKMGISENFLFLGKIQYDKLSVYYNMADIFILPSVRDSEGNLDDQSVSVIEAMACGKPVITTDFSGYRLVIKNNVDGFLLPQKNSDRITQTINMLVENPSVRKNISENARKKVLDNFTWNKIGEQYTTFFKQL